MILGAGYMLTMYKHVIFGPITKEENKSLMDLTPREIAAIVPVIVMIVWMGVYPKPFIDRIEPTVGVLLQRLERAGASQHMGDASRGLASREGGETERLASAANDGVAP